MGTVRVVCLLLVRREARGPAVIYGQNGGNRTWYATPSFHGTGGGAKRLCGPLLLIDMICVPREQVRAGKAQFCGYQWVRPCHRVVVRVRAPWPSHG